MYIGVAMIQFVHGKVLWTLHDLCYSYHQKSDETYWVAGYCLEECDTDIFTIKLANIKTENALKQSLCFKKRVHLAVLR